MKKLLALLLVVATLFCVAACGDNENTDTTTTTAQNSTTTTTVQDETTTAPVEGETTTLPSEGETTTLPSEGETTTVPVQGETTTVPVQGETTTTTTKPTTITTTKPPRPDANDQNNWNKVVNNVFTASNGGLQMDADGWKTYTAYPNLNMVPTSFKNDPPCNAICVSVQAVDTPEVFANKTEVDFENVLGGDIKIFEKTTVDGYPAYYAVIPDQMYCYVVNTPNHKYFINFLQAPGKSPMEQVAKNMMATVEIYK